jgi:arabinogalactan oligomer/maltooligosaccharide transport system substrate-binding protein
MIGLGKSTWLLVLAFLLLCLSASDCNGTPPPAVDCHGNLYVAHDDVARVTPSPRENYTDGQTYSWTTPPYGIEVTGTDGEADMQIYSAANTLLARYTIYAADSTNGSVSVNKWDGLSEITFNAGNFFIEDNGSQDICNLELFAGGVGITSVGTTYVITVRPEINEVKVAVLDGMVNLTSMGDTVTLDAAVPSASYTIINNGIIGPLQPITNPDGLREDISTGRDIVQPESIVPATLTLWADERLLPVLEEMKARFENDTGVAVQLVGMPVFDIADQYTVALQAGSAPDLVTLPNSAIYELVAGGSILPLEAQSSFELLMPGALQAFTYKGDVYGLPYAYENLALVSNPNLIPDIPPTWSELRAYLAEITAGEEFLNGLLIPYDSYYFFPVQSAFGGYIFGTFPDGTFNPQDLGMDSEGSLVAADWFAGLLNAQPFTPGDENFTLDNFQLNRTVMIVTGSWSLPRLREMGIPFQVNRFPGEVQPSQPFLTVYAFLISANSTAPDHAQNFLWNYLNSYEAVNACAMTLGAAPARRDVLENFADADLRAFGLAGEYGIPLPNLPEMNSVWAPWTDAIRSIIDGYRPAREAFISAADQIRFSINP